MGGERFPVLDDFRKRVLAQWGDERVNVIGHDDKLIQSVSLAVEVAQRVFDEWADFGFGEMTCSVGFIEPVLPSFVKQLVILASRGGVVGFGMLFEPFGALGFPLFHALDRHGIGGPKRNEIGRAFLSPMREIAAVDFPDGKFRVEIMWKRRLAAGLLRRKRRGRRFHFEVGRERGAGADNLVHHADGERAGTDGRVADGNPCQLVINQLRVMLDALRQTGSVAGCAREPGRFVKRSLVAEVNQSLDIGARNFSHGWTQIFTDYFFPSLFHLCFIRVNPWLNSVYSGVEVVDEALLTHVVDDLARGVEGAEALAAVFLDEVFKDLAEHFGVNGDFLSSGSASLTVKL